jgi:ppGpp synthetase/RelA/SpoT-type nucleotidyltranferase
MSVRRVDRAVADYTALRSRLLPATDEVVELVTGIIDDAGINYLSVTGRTKTVESFAGKARGVLAADATADPLRAVTDQVGVRVITYVQRDVDAVADLLTEQLTVLDDRDLGEETAAAGRFGYASRHLLVSRTAGATGYDPLACASIQLRTVLQHAWAEFEHDIRYKGTVPPEQVPDLDRRFTLAAGLLELADREFGAIRDRLQAGLGTSTVGTEDALDPRVSAPELATFLAGRYSSAGWSRTEHYAWISGLLLELGIASLDELSSTLRDVDSAAVTAAMGYRYPPGAVRRLDDDLLARFGDAYVGLHGNAHRREALRARRSHLPA